MSGRLGGVPGGESRFRLLVIIREAAARRKKESPVGRGPGKGVRMGKATLGPQHGERATRGTLWLHCLDEHAWGGPVFPGTSPPLPALGAFPEAPDQMGS